MLVSIVKGYSLFKHVSTTLNDFSGLTKMLIKRIYSSRKFYSTSLSAKEIDVGKFEKDSFTNVTPKIASYLGRNLHNNKEHPIGLIKDRLVEFFYARFKGKRGNPLFSVYDDLNPIVSTEQNFDSLLVPKTHSSRAKTDCYYLNKEWMLRAHMTAHQSELLKMGLNNFLMVGDVYRRDEIDSTHFPVFHQLDGVRTFTSDQLFPEGNGGIFSSELGDKAMTSKGNDIQEVYTVSANKIVESELKNTLEDLSKDLLVGCKTEYKWVPSTFPFTHPSWELEVFVDNKWVEMLGCGIIQHEILKKAGCGDRIGWAFGLGLERLAMLYYSIPDIRLFWSTDPGFLHQFEGRTSSEKFEFKPFSVYPPCPYDVSFWMSKQFEFNDFCELAREVCGDVIEQVKLVDSYKCKKTGRDSRCYRIIYRSMDRTLTKEEVTEIHKQLEKAIVEHFNVEIR